MDLRPERYAGAGVFIASFAVYLLTVAPGVTFWDSGELVLGAVTLGLPHPPGYPTFCILGKGAYFLPFGNAAYRLNLFSAFFGSLCAYLIYRLVYAAGMAGPARVPVAAAAALTFAFSGLFWAQAVVAEVYTLNTALLVLLAWFLLVYDREGSDAHLHASAFVLGLALATHQSIVFLLPAYALYYLMAGRVRANPKKPVISAFFALLGCSALLYLPVRASAGPSLNIGDPQVFFWFRWVLKLDSHLRTLEGIPDKLAALAGGGAALTLLAGAAVCAALIAVLRKRPYVLFLVLAAASYSAGIFVLAAGYEETLKWGLQKKFYLPALLFALPLAASAVYRLIDALWRRADAVGGGRALLVLAAWALLAVPAWAAAHNYREHDNSGNFFAFDFAANTLKSVMHGGALFAWGDNGVFPVWYLQGHERYREDVLFIHTEILTHPWYMTEVLGKVYRENGVEVRPPEKLSDKGANVRLIRAALDKRTPTYFDYSATGMLGMELTSLKPQGVIHLDSTRDAVIIGRIWEKYVLRGAYDGTTNKAFAAEGILDIYGYECGIWAQQAYAGGRLKEALYAYSLTRKLGYGDSYMDIWAEQIRRQMKDRKNSERFSAEGS